MIERTEFENFCKNKTIAIIGNSRSALEMPNGKKIDEHDIVLRMNRGVPTNERKEFIGTRTDLWSCSLNNHFQKKYKDRFPDRKYTILPSAKRDPYREDRWIPELFGETYWFGPKYYRHVTNRLNYERPSTGCLTCYYFLTRIQYKRISIFGMDFFEKPQFDIKRKKATTFCHSPKHERKLLTRLFKESPNVEWILP